MDRNTILAIALSIAVYSIWLGYQSSRQPDAPEMPIDASQQAEGAIGSGPETVHDARLADERQVAPRVMPDDSKTDPGPQREIPEWEGRFEGTHFTASLSNRGAALTQWTLAEFNELDRAGRVAAPIELVNLDERNPRALAMRLEDLGFGDLSSAVYEVVAATPNRAVFRLERGGLEIVKTYEFDLEGYGFELVIEVRNGSDRLVAPAVAIEWPAVVRPGNEYGEQSLLALHGGEVEKELVSGVGSSGFFDGLLGNGNGEEEVWRDVDWAGVGLKFFAALLLPESAAGSRVVFEPREVGRSAATILELPASEIAPGQAMVRRVSAFLGPKDPEILDRMGRQLGKSVDLGYSWFEPLTLFFQWLLHACYGIVPNFGWSIILITILVRVLMLPIMNRQMRSMERMRALQPRMKEIQAQFADDRQKQSEAMMALYKETGVNPLAGCLPMLLQFPVFIGLFFALQSSFDLRQAPFVLWINDLSAPEVLFMIPWIDFPFRVLPIIMGASMILQQKLTPTTIDPSQQMMMMVMMPVMMTVLFYQFPSGLVLYWMISNFLGIAHQLLIGRRMKAAEA